MATLLQLLNAAEQSIWKTEGEDQAKNAYRFTRSVGPSLQVEELSSQLLSDFLADISSRRSPATHNRYRSAIVSLLGVAQKRQWLDRLPCVPPSLDEDNKRTVTWREDWFTHLLQHLQANGSQLSVDLTKFIRLHGCRTNEARTLLWEQLETDEDGTIWVQFYKTKNGEPRTIRLAKAFYPIIDRLRDQPGTEIFPISYYDYIHDFDPAREAVAKHFKLTKATYRQLNRHCLRHTLATELVSSGGWNVALLQKHFGWKDINVAQRYFHVNAHDLPEYDITPAWC